MRAIIPVRSLAAGKTRLAGQLDPKGRRALVEEMAVHVIGVLRQATLLDSVAVLSADPEVLSLARTHGAVALVENDAGDLNDALEQARSDRFCREAEALLCIFGDLPFLQVADVREMAALAGCDSAPVIAPDRHGSGTNALLVRRDGLRFQFGPDSFQRHVAAAGEAAQLPRIYRSWGTAFDVDGPQDLALWRERKMELWPALA
jgi:2-phospho-L-lactate guanylyltransferase